MYDQIALALGVPVAAYLVARLFIGPRFSARLESISSNEIRWHVGDRIASLGFLTVALLFFLGSFR